ncbi:uncharacterized protein LOC114851978 [Betta splendens]|uniref:Uncharacterized protein LOC114851978 n=1 Tax=Betta splendens TaxID=158456 RepID=A0A6P7LZT1_BETSP|nr:uncharacterized protein LOC114851978 [Betta splendens]XP_028999776.1 uncharacterized protein LOC114851978 [Betta splendens]XP_055363274.1 uncharacterized protein LOC114851978 [Betta splendens]
MSTELYSRSASAENEARPPNTTVGGSKPLHRFLRGNPKIVGIVLLVLGTSFFTISMGLNIEAVVVNTLSAIPTGFLLGSLFILCGIMYILAEHNPTKKTVTISLALGVVTILIACWNALHMIMNLVFILHYRSYDYSEHNSTETEHTDGYSNSQNIGFTVEVIFTFYTLVGIIIFIVMSSLAGAALRSTKSQAVIMMTAAPTEAPVEPPAQLEDRSVSS